MGEVRVLTKKTRKQVLNLLNLHCITSHFGGCMSLDLILPFVRHAELLFILESNYGSKYLPQNRRSCFNRAISFAGKTVTLHFLKSFNCRKDENTGPAPPILFT